MTPKASPINGAASTVQLLSAQPVRSTGTSRSSNFGQVLENSMQPRPAEAPPTRQRSAEPRPEAQTPAQTGTQQTGERTPRQATERPSPAPEQPDATRSSEAEAPAAAGEPVSQASRVEASGDIEAADAVVDDAATAAEQQDPARLAALAALIAAVRGDTTATESEEGLSPPASRTTLSTTTSLLSPDAEGEPGGDRSTGTRAASAAMQAAVGESAKAPTVAEVGKTVATPRTTEALGALGAAPGPARNVAGHNGTPENAATPSSAAPLIAPRAEPAAVHKMLVPTPAGQRLWADDVANRVIWMAGRGEGRAELVLTPPTLGKLGVTIQMSGEQTTAHFVAASAAAREALEQALPRLREALQQAGITLGEASVSTSGEQQARSGHDPATGGDNRAQSSDYGILAGMVEQVDSDRWTQAGSNLVDIYA